MPLWAPFRALHSRSGFDREGGVRQTWARSVGGLVTAFAFLRCQDSEGKLVGLAEPARVCLSDVMGAIMTNEYGVTDALIPEMADALGQKGLKALQSMLTEARDARRAETPLRDGRAHHYDYTLAKFSLALQAVAATLGDVDAFAEALIDRDPANPVFASEIAIRLVAAGLAEEAMAILDSGAPKKENRYFQEIEWADGATSSKRIATTSQPCSLLSMTRLNRASPLFLPSICRLGANQLALVPGYAARLGSWFNRGG
jgi:hypothetical protein